jgi:hypothetical protein
MRDAEFAQQPAELALDLVTRAEKIEQRFFLGRVEGPFLFEFLLQAA